MLTDLKDRGLFLEPIKETAFPNLLETCWHGSLEVLGTLFCNCSLFVIRRLSILGPDKQYQRETWSLLVYKPGATVQNALVYSVRYESTQNLEMESNS